MNKILLALFALFSAAHADPQLTSWFTANSGQYARIYQSTADETLATRVKSATWTRGQGTQANPAYSDVNEILYSASWIYIRTTGLASHMMGPWYLDAAKTQNFPNFPSNTGTIYRIPRVPVIPGTKTLTGLGSTGRMVNGVSMFDSRDAFSYRNASATDATPVNGLTGDGIWNRDGYHNEGVTFDPALAHQAGNNYHYHAQPIGLRYQLGDHVDYDAGTNRYTESAAAVTQHSPIVAWAADGLPVYGPYGYSDPNNAASGVRRMVSGFTLRNGTNGTVAITVRQVLPLWAQRVQNRTMLTAAQYGPAVNATYLLGHYIEDFDYRGDLAGQTLGVDFDLNEQNVRFCKTPEFPTGTWAYFTTINADGTPQYPYTTGRQYYGDPTGGGVTSIGETVTQQFIGGANTPLTIGTPSVSAPNVTLTWSAVEGGTYSVDASAASNFTPFTNKATGLVATGISKSATYATLGSSGTEYGRVNRTALAAYDTTGQTAATVAQSTTTSYTAAASTAPTITAITNTPASPTSADAVVVKATVAASAGRTITGVQMTYNSGAGGGTTTVFNETMAAAAVAPWTGTNANNPWTVTPPVGAGGPPPPNPFSQTAAANHTAAGQGNQFGLEVVGGPPFTGIGDGSVANSANINAVGTAGYVEFYLAAVNQTTATGFNFQISTNGGTSWTTRITENNVAHTTHALFHYDLTAGERVSTLRMRFQFAGGGPGGTGTFRVDDIKVVTTNGSAPVTVNMLDNGASGDGAAGDGVYGYSAIPAQPEATTVSYTITATDSAAASTTTGTNSYTVVAANPSLAVTPATGLTSSGNVGGAFSPPSAIYTLTNNGTGTLNWTAAKTATWLTLSSASGSLAPGANTTVTATINTNANSLASGVYSDTVTFTNTVNGNGTTTRAVSLTVNSTVPPGAPTVGALAVFSQGVSKTISWAAVANATGYTVQISTVADFSTVLASQTVTGTSATFSNLASGVTYYYRVFATNNIGSSGASNVVSSTQDSVAPSVAITSPANGTTTATATITVNGTSSDTGSGISKVTVNGVTATTANNFANWTIAVPLGYGTNAITAVAYDVAGNVTTTAAVNVTLSTVPTYNPLIIPEVITGTTFNLNLHQTTKRFGNSTFQNTADTTTYAYNNMSFWGPTLIMNRGDWVQMNVTNNLVDTTTTHWHGFHIPAIMDGGPHQTVPAGTTWRPNFKVDNNAGLYWYHPHLHEFTQQQLTRGAGGLIIIRDSQEAALNLPRTYGVDDIPLALTSRRFAANQFVTANSAYGDYMLVNGTLSPQVTLPAQYVRLRILNAEMERSYNLGFSDNRTFYVITTDGGLVNAPVAVTRLVLGVAERAEILVNLTGATVGSSFDLMSYNTTATLPAGLGTAYPGGEPLTTGAVGSLLNNTNFNILHINVGAATANPVTTLPGTLANNTYWTAGDVTNTRNITITGGGGGTPFSFDNTPYSANVINHTLNLNAVERWNITNNSAFSHTIHIHDIEFSVLSRTGGQGAVQNYETGWKDTVYVQQNSTVSVIAKYDTFASNTNPFMFHCHFSPHEDGGLMQQFVVVNNAVEDLAIASFTRTGDNSLIQLDFRATPGTTYVLQYSTDLTTGSWTDIGSVTSNGTSASFTETDATRLGQARGFYRVTIPTVP